MGTGSWASSTSGKEGVRPQPEPVPDEFEHNSNLFRTATNTPRLRVKKPCAALPRTANNETTTMTRQKKETARLLPRRPGLPMHPTIGLWGWPARSSSGAEKCHCRSVVARDGERRGEERERSFARINTSAPARPRVTYNISGRCRGST